jgi:hypothetical protein
MTLHLNKLGGGTFTILEQKIVNSNGKFVLGGDKECLEAVFSKEVTTCDETIELQEWGPGLTAEIEISLSNGVKVRGKIKSAKK